MKYFSITIFFLLCTLIAGCATPPTSCPSGHICNFDGMDLALAIGSGRMRVLFSHSAGDYSEARSFSDRLAAELGLKPMGETRKVPLAAKSGVRSIDESIQLRVAEYGDGLFVRLEIYQLALFPDRWQEEHTIRQWSEAPNEQDAWRSGRLLKSWSAFRACQVSTPIRKLVNEAVCKWVKGTTSPGPCTVLPPRTPNGDRLAIIAHGMGAIAVYSVLKDASGAAAEPFKDSLRRVVYLAPPFEAMSAAAPEQCEAPQPNYGGGFLLYQGLPVVIRDTRDALASPMQSVGLVAVDVHVDVGGGNPGYFDSAEIIRLIAHGRPSQTR